MATLVVIVGFWTGVNEVRLRLKSTPLGKKIVGLEVSRTCRELLDLANHPWAGDYYAGDGLGDNRTLALAKEHFVFTSSGCVHFDRNVGSVAEKDGHVVLTCTFHADPRYPKELIVVRWSDRHYLVPLTEMKSFCDAVNRGREPRTEVHGSFLLRKGDEKLRANGFPEAPPEYRNVLLKHRVDATIVEISGVTNRPSVNGVGFTDTHVVIDAGTSDGIKVGMVLYVVRPSRSEDSVEIVAASATRSEGVVIQNGRPDEAPMIGWEISTKPWQF
jgi:hypothetical protein